MAGLSASHMVRPLYYQHGAGVIELFCPSGLTLSSFLAHSQRGVSSIEFCMIGEVVYHM
ncbi:hypothetical protein I7I48_10697 [Histoplasma ohiense]|nr:hypothetical protein I7I48_10697 [Histoplasma ohiense (nom. inval.)]